MGILDLKPSKNNTTSVVCWGLEQLSQKKNKTQRKSFHAISSRALKNVKFYCIFYGVCFQEEGNNHLPLPRLLPHPPLQPFASITWHYSNGPTAEVLQPAIPKERDGTSSPGKYFFHCHYFVLWWSQTLTSMVDVFNKAIWSSLVSSRKPGSCLAKSTISCTEIIASSVKWAKRCCLASRLLGSGTWGHGCGNEKRQRMYVKDEARAER